MQKFGCMEYIYYDGNNVGRKDLFEYLVSEGFSPSGRKGMIARLSS